MEECKRNLFAPNCNWSKNWLRYCKISSKNKTIAKFYTLLKKFSIGGNFLKILQQIYSENKIYVKLSEGLVQPFKHTVGVKQGCVFSPILFNLIIDKICSIFDKNCDPVQLNNLDVNCLLWADDLLLVSKTASGLQNSINTSWAALVSNSLFSWSC